MTKKLQNERRKTIIGPAKDLTELKKKKKKARHWLSLALMSSAPSTLCFLGAAAADWGVSRPKRPDVWLRATILVLSAQISQSTPNGASLSGESLSGEQRWLRIEQTSAWRRQTRLRTLTAWNRSVYRQEMRRMGMGGGGGGWLWVICEECKVCLVYNVSLVVHQINLYNY